MSYQLVSSSTVADYLTRDAAWAWSHGAEGAYLGMGMLYYALTYALRARLAVCLGSGGGFVPRLMRQAQRDLGIAGESRTILVDGNLPAAGWGAPVWLAPDSFFRATYPDVELVIDHTSNAARDVFQAQGLTIDYLHIDADHSFEGCLNDFQTYRPFLHEGSLVTLHDTHYPGAGVCHVVETIRTFADCELLDLPAPGAGTAIIRIGSAADGPHLRPVWAPTADESSPIKLTRAQDTPPLPPPEKEWKYLESPAFQTRYILAAHFVRDCPCVVEIGGAKTPIDQFLTGDHASVLVIDPLIREARRQSLNGRPCLVSHVRARFQDVAWEIAPGAEFGLVMLGMEFQGLAPEQFATLCRLVERARRTVIEFPPSWGPSREQFELIRARTCTRVAFETRMDLGGNDFGDLENSWPPRVDRMIYVLEPN